MSQTASPSPDWPTPDWKSEPKDENDEQDQYLDENILVINSCYQPEYPNAFDQVFLPTGVTRGSFNTRYGVTTWIDPSAKELRRTWYDEVLLMYSPNRNEASRMMTKDLRYLFQAGGHILSFVHIPSFFASLCSTPYRENIQPSIILACLALSQLMQSSEGGKGREGREMAVSLQSAAQAALQASINAQWLDQTLAQAAVVLVVFEACPHPLFSEERYASALRHLDGIVGFLGLPLLDVDDPTSTVFPAEVPPVLRESLNAAQFALPQPAIQYDSYYPMQYHQPYPDPYSSNYSQNHASCVCHRFTDDNPEPGHGITLVGAPVWDPTWTDVTIRQETCRRVCWIAVRLTSGYMRLLASTGRAFPQFRTAIPSNFALLFPGETLVTSDPTIPPGLTSKNSVWALNIRSQFLSNYCTQSGLGMEFYGLLDAQAQADRAKFSRMVLEEVKNIEDEYDKHTCRTEEHYGWTGREYLQHARMCVLPDYLRTIPNTGPETVDIAALRHEGREWVRNFRRFLGRSRGWSKDKLKEQVVRDPYIVWFLHQNLTRLLRFWDLDHTLTGALEIGLMLIPSIHCAVELYPSPMTSMLDELLHRLHSACALTGVSLDRKKHGKGWVYNYDYHPFSPESEIKDRRWNWLRTIVLFAQPEDEDAYFDD